MPEADEADDPVAQRLAVGVVAMISVPARTAQVQTSESFLWLGTEAAKLWRDMKTTTIGKSKCVAACLAMAVISVSCDTEPERHDPMPSPEVEREPLPNLNPPVSPETPIAPTDPVSGPIDPLPAPVPVEPAPADPVPTPVEPAPADPVPAPLDPTPAPVDPAPSVPTTPADPTAENPTPAVPDADKPPTSNPTTPPAGDLPPAP